MNKVKKRTKKIIAFILVFVMVFAGGLPMGQAAISHAEENAGSVTDPKDTAQTGDSEEDQEAPKTEESVDQKETPVENPKPTDNGVAIKSASESETSVKEETKNVEANAKSLDGPRLTSISTTASSLSNMAAGDSFDVSIGLKAPAGVKIYSVNLQYEYNNAGNTTARTIACNRDTPGESGSIYTGTVQVNPNAAKGTYRISMVDIYYGDGMYLNYCLFEDEGYLKLMDMDTVIDQIPYNKQLDYTVTTSEHPDNTPPRLTSVSMASTVTDLTSADVAVNVGYYDADSGINNISLVLEDENGQEYYLGYSIEGDGATLIGGGTRKIDNSYGEVFFEKGTYKLTRVTLVDCAENYAYYYLDSNNKLVDQSEQDTTKIDSLSFEITKEAKAEVPVIKSVSYGQGVDPTSFEAGQSYETSIRFENTSESAVSIYDQIMLCFMSPKGREITVSMVMGNVLELQAGEIQIVTIPAVISEYAEKGDYSLVQISYDTAIGTGQSCHVSYYSSGNAFIGKATIGNGPDDMELSSVGGFSYKGELDFTIMKADTPDSTAPIIESITVKSENITAPQSVTLEMKADVGYANIEYMYIAFEDVVNSKNWLNTGVGNDIVYNALTNTYSITFDLDKTIVSGTYRLATVEIQDCAGGGRYYQYDSVQNKLVSISEDEEVEFPGVEFKVVDSQTTDRDYDAPVLKSISFQGEQKVEAGNSFQVLVDVEEESDLKDVVLQYTGNDTQWTFSPIKIEKATGGYLCTYEVNPYFADIDLTLESIEITDNSVRANSVGYYLMDGELVTDELEESTPIEYNGQLDMQISRNSKLENVTDVDVNAPDIAETLTGVADDSTIVINYSAGEIPTEVLQAMKDKNLDAVIIGNPGNSELVIKGADLQDVEISNVPTMFEMYEIEEGGNMNAAIGYGMHFETELEELPAVPMTIRIKVSTEELEIYKSKGVKLYKDTAVEAPQVQAYSLDDVKVESMTQNTASDAFEEVAGATAAVTDGYVEITLSQGLQNIGRNLYLVAPESDTPDPDQMGDVNGDGKINSIDARMVLQYATGALTFSEEQIRKADMDGSGKINSIDARKILQLATQ